MSQSAESAAYLQMRLALVEARVRVLVAVRRSIDPDADDGFRGLYVSDAQVDRMLEAPGSASPPLPGLHSMPELADLEEWAVQREAGGAPLRLRAMAGSFGLDAWDVEILLISLAPDLDPRFERLYGYLNDDVSRRRACIGLALELCGQRLGASPMAAEMLSRLHPAGRLCGSGLVLVEEEDRPLLTRPLRVPDRVIGHLLGDDRADASVSRHLGVSPAVALPGSDQLARAIANGSTLLYLKDNLGAGGRSLGSSAFASAGMAAVSLDLTTPPAEDTERLARAAVREAQLAGGGLVAGPVDALKDAGRAALRTLCDARCPVILWGFATWDPLWSERIPVLLDAPRPEPGIREAVWAACLDGTGPATDDLETAVGQYRLTPDQIRRAADLAVRTAAAGGSPLTSEVLQAGARAQNAGALERLTRRITPRAGWDDLVLPADRHRQLKELAHRARLAEKVLSVWRGTSSRGRGVSALFAGESGTGKTMSAEILAGALGMDLYVIDLATVVDKYIGETEKNLERIFEEADRVNGVLLFDEADAVFGKRSQVQDAHDRYANVETAYLLQRIERFEGLAILTTNLRSNIDEAFVRRLDAIVDFPYPDEQDRRRLWEVHLRRGLEETSELDLDFLSQAFRLSGGNIANIVLGAAFLAASEEAAVGMTHLIRATESEYRKLGHLCVPEEFGPYYSLIASS